MQRTALRIFAVLAVLLGALAPAQQAQQRITPNFKDADITQIIEAVSASTGKNFIIDPRVRAQVTMLSTTPMTPDQFYQAFLSILQVHGFVAVPSGNLVKVLPDTNMRQMAANDLPDRVSGTSDEVVTQVISVRNVSAAQLVPVLRPLMPTNSQLAAVTGSNMLIISDRASNVSRLMRIIARIDQTGSADIDVIPLQSATAADTVRVLNTLLANAGGADAGSAVKVVADDRSNSILISGDASQRLRVKTLIAHLDTPADTGSETQVRYLRYANADTLASKLKEQMSSSGSNSGSSNNQNRLQNNPTNQPTVQTQGQNNGNGAAAANAAAANQSTLSTLSLAGSTATIWSDKDTNSLVVTASARTMRALMAVIDKLDIRRAQVLVQAIIVEVSADRSSELGVNWVLDASSTGVGAGTFISPVGGTQNNGVSIVDLYNTAKGTSTTVPLGTTFALGRLSATGINFAAMIRALQGDSRTNIIGQPQITTQDNQEAKIEVAQEVPFITGQYTNTTGTSSAFQTIQRQEVGTILTVTPQINTGDSVLLKIEVESSSLAASSAGAVDLITNKRTFSTNVLIPDGGTLVLGGLIQEKVTNSEQRVPLLGRIPILGELFRTRSTQKTKTNLMVFIQPKILRDDQAGIMETNAKYDYMRNEQKDTNRESTIIPAQPYYKTPLLPDLPQGNDKGNDKGNNKAPAPASDKSDIKPLKKDDIPDTGTQNPANPP